MFFHNQEKVQAKCVSDCSKETLSLSQRPDREYTWIGNGSFFAEH